MVNTYFSLRRWSRRVIRRSTFLVCLFIVQPVMEVRESDKVCDV